MVGRPTTRAADRAGGSAQAEYERRVARREQRIRRAHPTLGGLILALSAEPRDVVAWRRGAAGERAVAQRLDRLVDRGVEVLHDRRMPGTRGNIDHIAVSSSGVYVVDAKNYTGTVRVDRVGGLFAPRRQRLLVDRRDVTALVGGVQRQVQVVRHALALDPLVPRGVVVTGVLAFTGVDWPLFSPHHVDDIRLEGARSTARLVARTGTCSAQDVVRIAELVRTRFPPFRPGATGR